MFALFMGLSNFGSDAGRFLGSSLLKVVGDPTKPDYDGMATYCLLKSLMRLLPIALVPFLVPAGSPADSAKAMGAGAAITDADADASISSISSDDGPPRSDPQDAELLRDQGARVAEIAAYSSSALPPELGSCGLPDSYDRIAGETELTGGALPSSAKPANELHCRRV